VVRPFGRGRHLPRALGRGRPVLALGACERLRALGALRPDERQRPHARRAPHAARAGRSTSPAPFAMKRDRASLTRSSWSGTRTPPGMRRFLRAVKRWRPRRGAWTRTRTDTSRSSVWPRASRRCACAPGTSRPGRERRRSARERPRSSRSRW
jgi:hypothetical protein